MPDKDPQARPPTETSLGDRRTRSRARALSLTLLYHPDWRRVGERVLLRPLAEGKSVHLSGDEPFFSMPGSEVARPLGSLWPPQPIRMTPWHEGAGLKLRGAGSGATANGRSLEDEVRITAPQLQDGVILLLAGRVVVLLHQTSAQLGHLPESFGLVGESEGMIHVRDEIRRVADLDVPVLLRSETGTGKELVAQAIHRASRRRHEPFLSVNIAALPVSLAAAELFGAVKGAYTGSVRSQTGYFARAHGGTLFLDEIGDAPHEVQVMLLRVLETGEVQRLGSQETQRVDVRLIAATDADLEQAISEGTFREPLLHRLSGYEIGMPPLRDRRDDFGRLLFHFLRQELAEIGEPHRLQELAEQRTPWLPASIIARLAAHAWPGNVRQLRNVARQLVVASRGAREVRVPRQIERMLREAEARWTRQEAPDPAPEPAAAPARPIRTRVAYRKPSDVTEEELVAAMRKHRWQLKPAAADLGVSRPSLYALVEKTASIRKAADLGREEILSCHADCGGNLDAMVDRLEVSKRGLMMKMKELGLR